MSKRKKRKSRRKHRSWRNTGKASYEKGHLFEDVVLKYFEIKGFHVKKNVRLHGASGAVHEIDILLKKDDTMGIVEAKNYKKPLQKHKV